MTKHQGTETTSIFRTDIYMTTHKEQRQHRFSWQTYTWPLTKNRQHRYSWHTYTWSLTRNRDNIDIPDRHIHDHSQGTEATSIFLTHIYMTTHKEQRQHRYSWHTYTWPLTRNRDNIDIPDTYIHDHSHGTATTSILPVPCEWSCICMSGISMLSLFLVSGHVYVCQEYRCCLCSLWVVMYKCVRNIDVVSVPCEWSCISV
jgi:hypothetical protein